MFLTVLIASLTCGVMGFFIAKYTIRDNFPDSLNEDQSVGNDLSLMRRRKDLSNQLDNILENSISFGHSIETTLKNSIDLLESMIDSSIVKTRTFDETGDIIELGKSTKWSNEISLEQLEKKAKGEVLSIQVNDGQCYFRNFDIVDQHLGLALLWLSDDQISQMGHSAPSDLLNDWVELIDNFLAAKALSRRKHQALMRISDALKHPLLELGIEEAVGIFAEYAEFDDLILVCQSDDVLERHTTCFRLYIQGKLKESSLLGAAEEIVSTIERVAHSPTDKSLKSIGLNNKYWIKAPLLDALDKEMAGLVVIGSKTPIRPFQAELTDRFADYLRQRVVDFSKEYEVLSNTFPPNIVKRLLKEQDYHDRYLSPRERNVAIMYADLSGFTYVSEQVLVAPEKIAQFMNIWGYEVVQKIWQTGGVFDKMVGDCVIAQWGPPFYEMSNQEACIACLKTAKLIRTYTNELSSSGVIKELEDMTGSLGLSIGVNFAPLYVGHLGPGKDYTGYSSGMNNTARLQGLARRDEILCMESFVKEHVNQEPFSTMKSDTVKNVSESLKYRVYNG